jgi:hypothetical protein
VLPNLAYIPKKYHEFMLPATRRVYLDTPQNSDLKRHIEGLEQRNKLLEKDKVLLMEKCEENLARIKTHTLGERNAVKEAQEARKEARKMREMYEELKTKFEELGNQRVVSIHPFRSRC